MSTTLPYSYKPCSFDGFNYGNLLIASKCVETVVHFALKELGLKKINAGYYENNIGSAKVLEKCGFILEGNKISDVIFEDKRINSVLVGYVPN